MIIRVKSGKVKKGLTKRLCNWEEYYLSQADNHIFLMVFRWIYTGATLLLWEVKQYAKIIGYYAGDSGVILKDFRFTFTSFFRLAYTSHSFSYYIPGEVHLIGYCRCGIRTGTVIPSDDGAF